MSNQPPQSKPQPSMQTPVCLRAPDTLIGRKCKKPALKRALIASSDNDHPSDHSAPSLATPSVTGRKRSITPRSPNESVLSTTLGDRDEYGRAGRVRKEKDCVSYYAWRLDHTFKFIFARESSTWQAGAYACVDCKRIDSQWETFAYVRDDVFVGVDPSMGHVDHICLEDPQRRAKRSSSTEEAQPDHTSDAVGPTRQESEDGDISVSNKELQAAHGEQAPDTVSSTRQELGSEASSLLPLSPFATWFQEPVDESVDPPPQEEPQNDQDATLPNGPEPQHRAAIAAEGAHKNDGPTASRKSYGHANFANDAKTRLLYASKRYKGVSFRFNRCGQPPGKRKSNWFICAPCSAIIIKKNLSSVGVKRSCIVVLDNGHIVGKDPDAGTNHGHLCVEPAKVAELEALPRCSKGKKKSIVGRANSKKNAPLDRPGPSGKKLKKAGCCSSAAETNVKPTSKNVVKQEPLGPTPMEATALSKSNNAIGNPTKPLCAATHTAPPPSTSAQAAPLAAPDHACSSQAVPKKRSRRAAPQLDEPRDSLDVESLMADLCAVKQEVKEELLDEILTPGERAATIFAGFPI